METYEIVSNDINHPFFEGLVIQANNEFEAQARFKALSDMLASDGYFHLIDYYHIRLAD